MGYACPVCGDPQADAEHLANHLAFTAMLRDDGHESWLDEHVGDWGDIGPPELADRVAALADDAEYPQVFEDTTGHDHAGADHAGHDHGGSEHRHDGVQGGTGSPGRTADSLDDAAPGGVADLGEAFEGETDDVLAEAREMTRRRRANASEDAGDASGDDAESAGAEGDDAADAEGDETGDS